MAEQGNESDNPLQGYFEWQVTTLMLAKDLAEPLKRGDEPAHERRRHAVEEEVRAFTIELIPRPYLEDPSLEWPPDLMMRITRATLERAAETAGIA